MSLFALSELIVSEFGHGKVKVHFTFFKMFFNLLVVRAIDQTLETSVLVREGNKTKLSFDHGVGGFFDNARNNFTHLRKCFLELLKGYRFF